MANCLYILELKIEQPVSFSVRTEEVDWRWHARYGHLSFLALQKLHKEQMVYGLPAIEGVSHRQAEAHSTDNSLKVESYQVFL